MNNNDIKETVEEIIKTITELGDGIHNFTNIKEVETKFTKIIQRRNNTLKAKDVANYLMARSGWLLVERYYLHIGGETIEDLKSNLADALKEAGMDK